ncbi:MAG: restriction endonuclease [Dehalococcoidia bacterium]|nr:restriction endonuclease [Dehalococcoidia bacterium]
MPKTYRLLEITDVEFEEVIGDLLSAELGVRFERFTRGRDRGIDLRYLGADDNAVIAQCKQWNADSFPRLLRELRKVERPKVERLNPSRYLLATTVRMTPGRKEEILKVLQPWLDSPADIYGPDDIESLLRKHDDVVRKHLKLWLTSTEVLDAVTHADVVQATAGVTERLSRQIRLWVPNPSFDRASRVLDEFGVCVISGTPGIGKTMLAEILLAGYQALGYEPVAVSDDINEGNRLWREGRKQLFYYDDFLGAISYGELRLNKNEDNRLSAFIERVVRSDNKKMVLTTREYILREAQTRFERIAQSSLLDAKCIISLSDYTTSIRARILYNHLFFSDIPAESIRRLIETGSHWKIIRHRNYSPRLVEHMTEARRLRGTSAEDFPKVFLETLDNPTRLWGHVHETLGSDARALLLAIASLPNDVFLDDVRRVTESLLAEKFDTMEFQRALRTLEGTFIEIAPARDDGKGSGRIVTAHDPSVLDYLRGYLRGNVEEARRVLARAVFFEQCEILHDEVEAAIPNADIARRASDLISSESVLTRQIRYENGPVVREHRPIRFEDRTMFLCQLAAEHNSAALTVLARSALQARMAMWSAGRGDRDAALDFLRRYRTLGILPVAAEDIERGAFQFISAGLASTEDFDRLVRLSEARPELFFETPLTNWADEFRSFLLDEEDFLLHDLTDVDWLSQVSYEIVKVAKALDVDVATLEERLEQRTRELEEAEEGHDEDANEPESKDEDEDAVDFEEVREATRQRDMTDSEIQEMFEALATERGEATLD